MTTLTPKQEKAVKTVVSRIKGLNMPEPLTTLEGYAGTGKSTILPHILESLGFAPERVSFLAPTGKAAKVMRQKLKSQGFPGNTSTIHSAIYRAKPAPIAKLEDDLVRQEEELSLLIIEANLTSPGADPDQHPEVRKHKKLIAALRQQLTDAYREDKVNFQLNPDSLVAHSDLIIIDEGSMVGKVMANHLFSFGVPILAMGDPGQLPPVEDEPGLLTGTPDVFLTEVHRQAADNPIIHLATLARQGKDLPVKDYGSGVRVMKRKEYADYFDLEDRPQFLVGTNKTRWKVNQQLRCEFGFTEDPKHRVGPQAGEALIVCKNNRDNPDLVNGTECTATSSADLVTGEAKLMLSFDDENGVPYRDKSVFQGLFECHFSKKNNGFTAPERTAWRARKSAIEMDWAYAITVHKSQGSQWDDVVVIDESSVFGRDADKHLYTAVTRAAKTLTVLV